ncbi:MAG: succinic semialdehyde dehydrogenase [Halobacteriales archaeon]|nr:succinic semialdehyde dehydrogenase [Halobacteriales archaeon]
MATTTAPRWPERVDAERLDGLLGELSVPTDDGRDEIAVHQPTTGAAVGSIPAATSDDLDAAFERARAAQSAWRERAPAERRAAAERLIELVLDRREWLLDLIQLETGKARIRAYEEVLDVAGTAGHYADRFESLLAPERVHGTVPVMMRATVSREPYGVVGVIAPWNYPLTLAVSDALPALLAGNAVVLKPDDKTPFTALAAVRLCRQAGIPRDLFQVVTGRGPEVGPALVDRSDYVSFTGSTATGREVAARAGENLIDCSLELGGKNPLVVLDDADLDAAVEGAVRGCFSSAGQLCISFERCYVQSGLHDAFLDAFAERVGSLELGGGFGYDVEMGCLLDEAQLEKVEAHVAEAVEAGATVVTGGQRRPELGPTFYEPTVLTDVPPDTAVAREETFGPVVTVEPFDDVDEAVARANDSAYGLNASVWTADRARGRAVGERIDCGTVNVNEAYATAWGTVGAPMGGMKDSGIGRRHGREGLLKYTQGKTIAEQRYHPFAPSRWLPPTRFVRLTTAGLRLLRRLPRGLR